MEVLVIYDTNFKNWFNKKLVNSKKFNIEHFLYDNQSIDFIFEYIKKFNNIVFVLRNGDYLSTFPLKEVLVKIKNVKNETKNLINICFSHELNLFTFQDTSDKLLSQNEYSNKDIEIQTLYKNEYGLTQISCLINNDNVIFDKSIFPSSYIGLVDFIEKLFNNKNKKFLKGKHRFGINVNRHTPERFKLVKEILSEPLQNSELITISKSKLFIGQCPPVFNKEQLDILLKNENDYIKIYADTIYTANSNNGKFITSKDLEYWEDGYKLFSQSKIEIILETFNYLPNIENWQLMFTEKTLKSLWAGKPMLFSDPISFQLFKKWGFKIDNELYGMELISLFENFKKSDLKNSNLWIVPFVKRLKEIDKMNDNEFNEIYLNSLKISDRNKKEILNWDLWYNNIDKWFLNK